MEENKDLVARLELLMEDVSYFTDYFRSKSLEGEEVVERSYNAGASFAFHEVLGMLEKILFEKEV